MQFPVPWVAVLSHRCSCQWCVRDNGRWKRLSNQLWLSNKNIYTLCRSACRFYFSTSFKQVIMAGTKPSFELPKIYENAGGWGPTNQVIPLQFRDIPYAPYSKGDKLGRVADWTNPDAQKQDNNQVTGRTGRTGFNRFNREQQQAYGASFASAFAYTHTEDESSFSVVDNRSAAAKKMALKSVGGGQRNRPQNKQTTTTTNTGYRQTNQRGGAGNRQQQGRKKYGYNAYDKRVRTASIAIGPDWKVLDEIEFSRLSKLNFTAPEAIDVATFGSVKYYNKAYDRVNTKNEKALAHIERIKYDTTASDDPIIQQFLQDNTASVFATDTVLALLMCATRTIHPWDIVVKKIGDKVILDKRPNGIFDYVPVNENAADPPLETDKDNLNSWAALCHEATYINQNFARQVLDPNSSLDFDKPNPFATEDTKDKLASCGYRYRKFSLSGAAAEEDEEKTYLMVRTEVDAAIKLGNNNSYIMVRALNEYDPNSQGSLPWKKSLDSQRGAVVAAEMKNNAAKLARWAVQALLAGADQLKLGYVARVDPKNNRRHTILGTQAYKPRDFAAQMNLSLPNGWGVVKAVSDMCLQLPEGKYILMKDPNRAILRVYEVPSEEDLDRAGQEQPQDAEAEDANDKSEK